MTWLSPHYRDVSLLEHGFRVPFKDWYKKCNSLLHMEDPSDFFITESVSCKLIIKTSTICHPMEGEGLYATEGFDQGHVSGHGYGSLVYPDLEKKPQNHRWYVEGILSVTVPEFIKWTI